MSPRGTRTISPLVLLIGLAAALVQPALCPGASGAAVPMPAGPAPAGGYLPDSYVLARVGARKITVYDFRERYFAFDATLRPAQDSVGRASFLQSMVDKDVLGQAALKTNRTLGFEDRAELRAYHNTALTNRLYAHAVLDSSAITEDSLQHVCGFYHRELKLRLLYFTDRSEAERVRRDLIAGRMPWSVALGRWAVKSGTVVNGISDWLAFDKLPTEIALQIWPLRVGATSPIVLATSGYHIVQVADERPHLAPPCNALRPMLKMELTGIESETRRQNIQGLAKQGMDVVYDSTNVAWASTFFRDSHRMESEGLGTTVVIDPTIPEFSPADTARLILKWNAGRLSLGDLVHAFADLQPLLRPSLNTPERLLAFADATILGPRMLEFALARGLERDSVVVAMTDLKREEILVTHMVEDSVLNRISVTRDERQAYYREHQAGFMAFPSIRYAVIVRPSKTAADSVVAMLDAGAAVESIVAADSARGVKGTGTNTMGANEPSNLHKILFDELRPGKSTVYGPDKQKLYGVLHLISYDPGQLVPFEQVDAAIDESVRNEKGDRGVHALIGRLAKGFAIESHPDVVLRILLTDPANEESR